MYTCMCSAHTGIPQGIDVCAPWGSPRVPPHSQGGVEKEECLLPSSDPSGTLSLLLAKGNRQPKERGMELVALGKGGLVLGPEIRVGWVVSPTENHPHHPGPRRPGGGAEMGPPAPLVRRTETRPTLAYSFLPVGKSAFGKVSNKHIHLEASELYGTVPGRVILQAIMMVNLREPNGRLWVGVSCPLSPSRSI